MPSPARRVLFAVVAPIQRFFRLEAAGGIVLIVNAVVALVLANSSLGEAYGRVVGATIRLGVGSREATLPVHTLINEVLMTVFFVVAGMEIKREIVTGELRSARRAALPLIAAAGGMIAPALIYLAFNPRGPSRGGWAIPTATDIAFALGCLSMVRRRVPWSLFVFLTALAIFDDLGAILIIALAYGSATHLPSLAIAVALAGLLFAVARPRIYRPWLYIVVGVALWVAVARSGLHPTLAGVVIGLGIPTSSKRSLDDALEDLDIALESLRQLPPGRAEGSLVAIEKHVRAMQAPVERLLHGLHGPVAFGIVPLFALANAGIVLKRAGPVFGPVAFGVAAALVAGKCLGVLGAVFAAVRLKIAPLPSHTQWKHMVGTALLAGIGFTMSLFITGLAFPSDPETAMSAKVGILTGSLVSSLAGLAVLRFACGKVESTAEEDVSVVPIDLPRFAEGYRVASWQTARSYIGRTLANAALRRDHGVTVLGVFREHDTKAKDGARYRKLEAIDPDYTLADGDTLLVVGERERVDRFLTENSPSTSG
jgi:NhaA family Na+:H+ antiporter